LFLDPPTTQGMIQQSHYFSQRYLSLSSCIEYLVNLFCNSAGFLRHISKLSTFSDNINMSKFLHKYLKENLFQKMKGRKFKGLENFMNNICLKKPAELIPNSSCL
jgi:hypothetical protein